MLWTPGNDFMFSVDNFGATYTDAGIGLNCPGNASANVKGANTSMLVGIAEDCYGILIGFSGGNTSAATRRNLVDLLIDPAAGVGNAGSSWAVAIANLYCAYSGLIMGGYWYYFPLYLAAGTAIGGANQSLTASTSALRMCVRCYGKPSHPELIKVGSKVETIGAVTATTTGTAFTPGTGAMGSYSSMGTTTNDLWWWQVGMGWNDTSLSDGATLLDVAAGDASNKRICAENVKFVYTNAEQGGKDAFGSTTPRRFVKGGETVYVRGATILVETTPTAVVYGLGG